jgi:hypothetical protein
MSTPIEQVLSPDSVNCYLTMRFHLATAGLMCREYILYDIRHLLGISDILYPWGIRYLALKKYSGSWRTATPRVHRTPSRPFPSRTSRA